VSQPQNLFSVNFTYDANPLLMQVLNVGAGTGVKTTNVSSVTLATGGNTSGDGSILQQRSYNIYQPGKSQFIQMTGIIGAAKANVRSQIGYYDVNNGVLNAELLAEMVGQGLGGVGDGRAVVVLEFGRDHDGVALAALAFEDVNLAMRWLVEVTGIFEPVVREARAHRIHAG
jgi:hypothetical protein